MSFIIDAINWMFCGCCCARKPPKETSYWDYVPSIETVAFVGMAAIDTITSIPSGHMIHPPHMGRVPMPFEHRGWDERQMDKLKENGGKMWDQFKRFQKDAREHQEYNDPRAFEYNNRLRQHSYSGCVIS